MKKNFHALGKRALALLVSLTMCVSLLQITAFAAEGEGNTESKSESYSANVESPTTGKTETVTGTITSTDTGKTWEGSNQDGSVTVKGSLTESGPTPVEGTGQPGEPDINVTPATPNDETNPTEATGGEKTSTTTTVTEVEKQTVETETVTGTDTKTEFKSESTTKGDTLENEKNVGSSSDYKNVIDQLEDGLETEIFVRPGEEGEASANTAKDDKPFDLKSWVNEQVAEAAKKFGGEKDSSGNLVKTAKDENGNEYTVTFEEVYSDDGKTLIGYRTTQVKDGEVTKGEPTIVQDTTEGNLELIKKGHYDISENQNPSEYPDPTPDQNGPTVKVDVSSIERPTDGSTFTHADGTEGTVSSVEDLPDGKGYKVTTTIPVYAEDGTTLLRTEERTENVYFTTTIESIDTTSKTDVKVEKTEYEQVQGEVTETRTDEVTVETIVSETTVPELNVGDNDSLKVNVSMSTVTADPEKFITYEGDPNIPGDEKDITETVKTLPGWNGAKEEVISANCILGTTVKVTQKDTTGYNADVNVVLDLKKSQLSGDLKLVVTVNNQKFEVPLTDEIGKNNETDLTIQRNENGDITGVTVGNVKSGSIELNLIGKQHINYQNPDCTLGGLPFTSVVNLQTKIDVSIAELKAEQVTKTTATQGTRKDTVTTQYNKTIDVTDITTTTTTTDKTIFTTVEEDKSTWYSTFTYPTPEVPDTPDNPGDNTNPGGNGGGTGGGGGTTPTPPVDIPDDPNDVPLEPGPGDIDNPDVPENPGDVDIEEPDVPLAPGPDTPSDDVNITDNDVPMANKPSKPAGKNPVPQSSATGLTEIEEEAVPLAEVPKTGDNSAMWIAAAVLAACGLVALGQKKREEA